MSEPSIAISSSSFSPAATSTPVPNRPIAARTRLLEGPVPSTLLRLSAPNVLCVRRNGREYHVLRVKEPAHTPDRHCVTRQ
jgi:hypothetical protein